MPATRAVLATGLILSGPAGTDVFGPGVRQFVNANGVQQIGELVLLVYLLAGPCPVACGVAAAVFGRAALDRPPGRGTVMQT